MTKQKGCVLITVVLVPAPCCAGLQQQIDELYQSALAGAYNAFLSYQASGNETNYFMGTSQLCAFQTLYPLSSKYKANYFEDVNNACFRLLGHPEMVDEKALEFLIEGLDALNADFSSFHGYIMPDCLAHSGYI